MNSKPATEPASPFDDGELYDILLGNLRYGVDFYVDLARAAKGPVLEIACGTGRILIPCLQAGADVDGLDLFEPMLKRLREKAADLGLAPRLYQADMSDFHVPRRYAVIMITFNAFIHNLTQDAQIHCLERCREHLLPGGLLAFDAFFPGLEYIQQPAGTRVLEEEVTDPRTGLPVRIYDTRTLNRIDQIQHSVNEVEFLDREGRVTKTERSEFDTRFIYKAEMELLLRVAGFARWEIYGDFERRPLTKETDSQIVMAWTDGEA